MRIQNCLCCGSEKLTKVFEFPATPLTDNYYLQEEESLAANRYRCAVMLCNSCTHLQLEEQTNQEDTYKGYQYKSNVTSGINKNFNEYASKMLIKMKQREEIKHLDIGSNDGSFIEACRKQGIISYGVEPASALSLAANKRGRPTHCGFFNEGTDKEFKETFPKKYDIITFNNVLANLAQPKATIENAKKYLKDSNSIICVQTGYHPVQFNNGLFDYIYHEHYSYFNNKSMDALVKSCGLILNEVEYSKLRGGTARFWISKKKEEKYIVKDDESFSREAEYKKLNSLIETSAERIRNLLSTKRSEGIRIVGFGASHSTGMLVSKFGLKEYIDTLVDENQEKKNKYMPGTKLRVEDPWSTITNKDIVIVLAWQYYAQIKKKLILYGVKSDNIIKPIEI